MINGVVVQTSEEAAAEEAKDAATMTPDQQKTVRALCERAAHAVARVR